MSSRKTRKSTSSIPKATLERAREQAGLPAEPTREATPTSEAKATPVKTASKPATSGNARKTRVTAAQLERAKKRDELDHEMVAHILAHPTKMVTEEELHQAYGYVLRDLRNMGLLAAALMVVLVVIAQFL